MNNEYYLDNSATTKPEHEVVEAMMPYLNDDKWYNPSSLYLPAKKVKEDIENARRTVGDFINAYSNEIFFTSGGSESNCLAIRGFVDWCELENHRRSVVITTEIEHKSIMECVKNLPIGVEVIYIGVDEYGFVNAEELERSIASVTGDSFNNGSNVLVSIAFANNEIGTIQNINELANIVHKYNAVFHVDAVQALGHIPIDVRYFDIDMMSASGHKIGCPKGIGFLYKRSDINIKPIIYGSQMDGIRGGTENVPYIMAMAKAVELLPEKIRNASRVKMVNNYFTDKLVKIGCKLNGVEEERLPNNISVILPEGINGESFLYSIEMSGIYISTGSACNSHSVEPSHVLKAIGLTDDEASRTIRITFDSNVSVDDIDSIMYEIERAVWLFNNNFDHML